MTTDLNATKKTMDMNASQKEQDTEKRLKSLKKRYYELSAKHEGLQKELSARRLEESDERRLNIVEFPRLALVEARCLYDRNTIKFLDKLRSLVQPPDDTMAAVILSSRKLTVADYCDYQKQFLPTLYRLVDFGERHNILQIIARMRLRPTKISECSGLGPSPKALIDELDDLAVECASDALELEMDDIAFFKSAFKFKASVLGRYGLPNAFAQIIVFLTELAELANQETDAETTLHVPV